MDKLQQIKEQCIQTFSDTLEQRVGYTYEMSDRKTYYSPIEEMFAYMFHSIVMNEKECITNLGNDDLDIKFNKLVYGTSGNKYYADFCFTLRKSANNDIVDDCKLLIELDGYLWHGKNPDQFQKEKERERDLVSNGYTLLRFTGKDIYRNCYDVVWQSIDEYMKRVNPPIDVDFLFEEYQKENI